MLAERPGVDPSELATAAELNTAQDSDLASDAEPTAEDARRLGAIDAMLAGYAAKLPAVPEVTAAELLGRGAAADADPVVLLDCREPYERAVSVLPGAISRAEFDADPQRYRGSPVVVYCTIGYRSTKLADTLRRRGFDAVNLRGGVLAWAHAGGRFVDAQGRATSRVNVYGSDWDLLPHAYQGEY